MSNNKHVGFSGKGYYIALILCAVAIGISGYLYSKNASKEKDAALAETAGNVQLTETERDIPVIATQPASQSIKQKEMPKPTSPIKFYLHSYSASIVLEV